MASGTLVCASQVQVLPLALIYTSSVMTTRSTSWQPVHAGFGESPGSDAEALRRLTSIVRITSDIESIALLVLDTVVSLIRADTAVIYRVGEDALRVLASSSPHADTDVSLVGYDRLRSALSRPAALYIPAVGVLPDDLPPALIGGSRSWLAVPLVVSGKPFGLLTLGVLQPPYFSDADAARIAELGSFVALAFESATMLRETRAALQHAEALRQMAEAVGQSLSLQDTLDVVLLQLAHFFEYDRAAILVFGQEGFGIDAVAAREYHRRVTVSLQDGLAFTHHPAVLAASRALAGQRFVAADVGSDWPPLPVLSPWASLLAVPLVAGRTGVAVLLVASANSDGLDDRALNAALLVAQHTAQAVVNARRYAEERQQLGHARVINRLLRQITAGRPLDDVFQLVLEEMAEVIDFDSGNLMLLRDGDLQLVADFGYAEGFALDDAVLRAIRSSETTAKILEHAQPHMVPNTASDPDWVQLAPAGAVQAYCGFPLVVHGRVIGILNLDRNRPEAFSRREIDLAADLAAHAAIAIENVLLYAESQAHVERLGEIIATTGEIATQLDLQRALDASARSLARAASASVCAFFSAHNDETGLRFWFGLRDETPMPEPADGGLRLADYPLVRAVIDTNEPARLRQSATLTRFAGPDVSDGLLLPLPGGTRLLGVVCLAGGEAVRLLNAQQVTMLHLMAQQIGTTLENARLFEESQRQTKELLALLDTSVALSSIVAVDELLDRLYVQVRELMAPDGFGVILNDDTQGVVEMLFVVENDIQLLEFKGMRLKIEEAGLTGWVIRKGRPLLVSDTFDRGQMPVAPRILTDEPTRAWLGVPLTVQDRVIGALTVQSFTPGRFTEDDLRFLQLSTVPVAVALSTANLVGEDQRQSSLGDTLRALAALLTEDVPQAEVFERVLDLLARVVDFDSASLCLMGADGMEPVASRGLSDTPAVREWVRERGRVAMQGGQMMRRAVLVVDAQSHLNNPSQRALPTVRAWIGAPLLIRDRLIGTLFVNSTHPSAYSDADTITVMAFANQAAIAIENASLFETVKQQTTALEAAYRAGLELTRSLALDEVIDAVLTGVMALSPRAIAAHIFLGEAGALRFGGARYQSGRADAPYAMPREDGLNNTVAHTREMIVAGNVATHPLFAGLELTWQGAIVGVPLTIGSRLLGTLSLAFDEPQEFSDDALRVLRLLCDQASIAIENANLHMAVTEQSRTDVLSGLPNRRALDERLVEAVRHARRHDSPLSVLMMDLDGYKRINDRYGHLVGDEVLEYIARGLQATAREGDFLARFGGDEFALLMPDTDPSAAVGAALRMQQAVVDCHIPLPDGRPHHLTISVGVASFPINGTTGLTLLGAADQALYYVKRHNKGAAACAIEKSSE